MTDTEAARILMARFDREMAAACEAGDRERVISLATVPVTVWLVPILQEGAVEKG